MSEDRYIARSTAIASRALGDELIVMSATDSTLFTLNEIAMHIWNAADGITSLKNIVALRICDSYDVTPELALKDAEEVVTQLAEHGLLMVSDEPIAPVPGSIAQESA